MIPYSLTGGCFNGKLFLNMVEAANLDPWERARDMAEGVTLVLPNRMRTKIGPFLYDNYGTAFFSFRHEEDERFKDIYTQVGFATGKIPGPGLFYQLAVRTPGLGQEVLLYNHIKQNEALSIRDTYPSFEFRWIGGKTNPEEKGRLQFMRIDLAPDTFINYYLGQDPDVLKSGNPVILQSMPDSLEGVTELLRRPIPWKIDFDQYGREILERSLLEQFRAACFASL